VSDLSHTSAWPRLQVSLWVRLRLACFFLLSVSPLRVVVLCAGGCLCFAPGLLTSVVHVWFCVGCCGGVAGVVVVRCRG